MLGGFYKLKVHFIELALLLEQCLVLQVALSPLQVLEGTVVFTVGQSKEEKNSTFSRFGG